MLSTASIVILLKKDLHDLQGAYLFGSFASGFASSESDVDLAVLCRNPLPKEIKFKLIERLENLLNRTIDLIELRFVNTIFQEEIMITAKPIVTIDQMACDLFEDFVYCSAMDFREFRKPHVEEILARGSVYG